MAVAFKGNTIAIIILCVVTIVVFVMYGFDKIKTNDEEPNIPNLAAASKHHIRKKDYVGALTEAVRQIRVDTNLIHQRLEMDYEPWQDFYMMIWNMPEHAWEIIRYKFAVKILKGFLEQQPPSFTMIFTGTSVTAGHESFYSRSYVGIIEERLKKSLTAAGVNLIVRNAAQPAFGCQVNNYCFPSLSIGPGEEIDFFAWENTFNCGAENAPSLEYFSRIAAQHKAVAFYSASGGAPLNNCQPSPDPVPYVSYDWTPEVAGITHTYAPSMAKVSEYKAKMVKRFHLGSAADRLVRLSQRPYKGTAPHGMSMYARTREACNATQVLNPKYVPSTSRAAARRQLAAKDVEPSSITMPMTRKAAPAAANAAAKAASAAVASSGAPASAASAATAKAAKPSNKNATTTAIPPTRSPVASCATNDLWATMCHDQGGPKILTKEFSFKGNAPGVVQGRASYNPSAGSHLLRAELFLYNYNHVLLDAIFNLQKDLSLISAKHQNDPDGMFRHQLDVYERKLAGLQRTLTTPLAEPKHCPAWECGNPMENTQCFTDYQPNYLAAPATGAAATTAASTGATTVTRDHTLSSLVMGNVTKAGWQRAEKNMLSAKQFGNKDRQIYFFTEEFNARLPIALVLPHGKAQLARNAKEADMAGETEGIVKLFAGSDKATLEHAEFYLELDVATTDAELFALQRRVQDRLYAAANKTPVKLIKDVHYVYAKGHVHFFGLPKGYHILFVQSPTEQVSAAVAQRMTAAYAKAYREQQEDSDVSTTAVTAKKTSKVAGTTTTTATATKKKPAAKVVAADGDERRRLAATDASSVTSAKSLLKPKADANGEEGNKKEEEKKKGPRVVDATAIAKVSVGQMVVF